MNQPAKEMSMEESLCPRSWFWKGTRFAPWKKRMNCFCDRHPTALLTVALAVMPIGMIGAVFAVTALLSLPLLLITQALQ